MAGGRPLSRRQFLAGGAGLAGVLLVGEGWAKSLARPVTRRASSLLEVYSAGFPRTFVYRQASILAGLLDYPTWLEQMSPLNGIIGKVLPEEEPVAANALNYFTLFKQQFPNKLVLEHLNGWERVPVWETTNWFAGFWLHAAGTTLAQPCAAADTTLYVSKTTCFTLQAGSNRNRGNDICIAAMGSTGPDFTYAEQVSLTGINAAAGTITVNRGQYGTSPLSFAAGAFIAPHITRGPFGGVGPMLWMYNFSTMAPTDPSGHTVIDAILDGMAPGEGIAGKFQPGGALSSFDGTKIDAMAWDAPLAVSVDANNDGVADNGIFNGVNTFGQGEEIFLQRLRSALGANRIIIIDAETVTRQRPDSALITGVELEGFPNLYDVNAVQWSEGMTTLQYYSTALPASAGLVYANYKTDYFPSFSGDSAFRLSLAASLVAGTAYTFYTDPDGGTPINGLCQNLTIWDEILGGTLQTPNWMGQPVGPAVHPSVTNDVLNGAGVNMTLFKQGRFNPVGSTTLSCPTAGTAGAILTAGAGSHGAKVSFHLAGIPLAGSDLIIQFDVQSAQQSPYPATLLRRLFVTAQPTGATASNTQSTPTGTASPSSWFTAILYFRGLSGTAGTAALTFGIEGPEAISIRNLTAYNGPDVIFRQFQNGAVFANPSLASYTFNVSALAPGAVYKRLLATGGPGEDAVTNNGQLLGSTVTVPGPDALIVLLGP
jgi:hypothetical protein